MTYFKKEPVGQLTAALHALRDIESDCPYCNACGTACDKCRRERSPYLTPTELARVVGLERRDVIAKCMAMQVPIFQGRVSVADFKAALDSPASPSFQRPSEEDR